MRMSCSLLIVGAGPYGLAMAAMAQRLGLDFAIVGQPLEFWRKHTPPGMLLRSGSDWHIDPLEGHTFQRYLREQDKDPEATPLSREDLLGYLKWFVDEKRITVLPALVDEIHSVENGFRAVLDSGRTIAANFVVAALGYASFPHLPRDVVDRLPPGRFSHTCDTVDFKELEGRECLIVGGRQSAFEWAALLAESGVKAVHVVYRHETPRFQPSDWSWARPLVDRTLCSPRWFRDLEPEDRDRLEKRFWHEGREKLEPWLGGRIRRSEIVTYPETRIVGCRVLETGRLQVRLASGASRTIDHVLLATGYRVDLQKVELLRSLLEELATERGYPQLDEHFQSSVPGLFFAGLTTVEAFGPFFGFLLGATTTAQVIGRHLTARSPGDRLVDDMERGSP